MGERRSNPLPLTPECFCPSDESNSAVLKADGTLDRNNVRDLHEQILSALSRNASHIRVDLSGVNHMDTAGLASLVEAVREARLRRVCLSLTRPSAAALDVIRLSRLGNLFSIDGE